MWIYCVFGIKNTPTGSLTCFCVQPATEIRIPDNQLQLGEPELDEEIAKMLTANNPEAPKAPVRFIQKERAYKPEAMVAQTMTHYATDGWLLHQESEDAKKQLDQHKVEEELQKKFMSEVKTATDSAGVLTLIVFISHVYQVATVTAEPIYNVVQRRTVTIQKS